MDPEEVAALIEAELPGAAARVTRTRGPADDDHLGAVVVSPAFEGRSLVEQHELVFDALGEHMTRDVHALEVRTYTPEEAPDDAPTPAER